MANVYLKSKKQKDNGSVDKTFAVDWVDLEAEFVVNETGDGWEIDYIHVIKGDKDEIEEIVDHYMMNEYEFDETEYAAN
jgi:light-regulated signal transduction histidine kinase (bacteriophytochrome)